MNEVDQLLTEISDIAKSELWQDLPALDDKIREHFTLVVKNCPEDQVEQVLSDLDRTTQCYSEVLALCHAHRANLKEESSKLQQQKMAVQGYTSTMSC